MIEHSLKAIKNVYDDILGISTYFTSITIHDDGVVGSTKDDRA